MRLFLKLYYIFKSVNIEMVYRIHAKMAEGSMRYRSHKMEI